MIEIGVGLLTIAAAIVAGLGYADRYLPIMLGLGTAGIVAGLGALLVCHGLYRVRLKKAENRHWLRSSGLMCQMLGLLAVLGFAIHAFVPLLNAFRIADFPLGYYMAAQGSLIAFVILLFFFAARANAIDVAEDAAED